MESENNMIRRVFLRRIAAPLAAIPAFSRLRRLIEPSGANAQEISLQAPLRGASIVGAQVYSHSGEFSPRVSDLAIPGRGISFRLTRKYRSSMSGTIGKFGRGWTFSYAKRLEERGRDVVYHDGFGRVHLFIYSATSRRYETPEGFYSTLSDQGVTFLLNERYGAQYFFESPRQGGRVLRVSDRNKNQLQFSYSSNG